MAKKTRSSKKPRSSAGLGPEARAAIVSSAAFSVAIAIVLVGAPARADGLPARAFELGVRVGPSFVAGEAEDGVALANQVGAPPAFALDIGYRATERLYFGAFWPTAVGLVRPEPCRPDYRCPGPSILSAVGGIAHYHLGDGGRIDPWIGAGVAFAVQGGNAVRSELRGGSSSFCIVGCGPTRVEFSEQTLRYGLDGILEGGVDFRVSRRVGLGLALSAFAGKYLGKHVTDKVDGEEVSSNGSATGASMHLWMLVLGRAVFDFGPPPRAER